MVFSWFNMALALAVAGGLLAFVPLDTFAWGKAGHRVVATPATSQLTPEARTQVTEKEHTVRADVLAPAPGTT